MNSIIVKITTIFLKKREQILNVREKKLITKNFNIIIATNIIITNLIILININKNNLILSLLLNLKIRKKNKFRYRFASETRKINKNTRFNYCY